MVQATRELQVVYKDPAIIQPLCDILFSSQNAQVSASFGPATINGKWLCLDEAILRNSSEEETGQDMEKTPAGTAVEV